MPNAERKRMVFMGSDPIALPALREISGNWSERVEIVACFTQPDRRTGRGKKVRPNAIKTWAGEQNIPVRQPEKLADEEAARLRETGADFVLVMAYGHLLRKSFLKVPPLGIYNLHTSILPKYRGAAPLSGAIAEGDNESGVSLMRMVRRMDAGPVADVERFPLDRVETGETIVEKAAEACVPLLRRNLEPLLEERLAFREQAEDEATYVRKLEKDDGLLDFSAPARVLARRINALHPWPGCRAKIEGESIRLGLADFVDSDCAPAEPGTILASEEALEVATGRGILRILRLQRPGGKLMETRAFLRGFRVQPGRVLPSAPMKPIVANEPFETAVKKNT